MRKYRSDDVPPYVIQLLCSGLSSLIVGMFSACWLIPFAYTQRGYSAVGGEWLVVLAVSFAAFQGGKWLFGRTQT